MCSYYCSSVEQVLVVLHQVSECCCHSAWHNKHQGGLAEARKEGRTFLGLLEGLQKIKHDLLPY